MLRAVLGAGLALIPVLLSCFAPTTSSAGDADELAQSHTKHVRPLPLAKCVSCHGAEKQKGGLRLDSRAALLKGGDSGPALVPGKPAESLLIKAVGYTGQLKMPPKGKLSDTEIALLSRWIESGAVWPESKETSKPGTEFAVTQKQRDWWAFQPVKRPDVPKLVSSPVSTLARALYWAIERNETKYKK